MVANYEAGSVVQGKVTGIKPFGAFIALDDKTQGLVHISEVAHSYVKDIHDYLSVGDEVNVKILKVDEDSGKISLSIRATEPKPERVEREERIKKRPPRQKVAAQGSQGFNTLEDKLKEWLKESNDRQAQLNKRLKR